MNKTHKVVNRAAYDRWHWITDAGTLLADDGECFPGDSGPADEDVIEEVRS